jgi:hypothetical protein
LPPVTSAVFPSSWRPTEVDGPAGWLTGGVELVMALFPLLATAAARTGCLVLIVGGSRRGKKARLTKALID